MESPRPSPVPRVPRPAGLSGRGRGIGPNFRGRLYDSNPPTLPSSPGGEGYRNTVLDRRGKGERDLGGESQCKSPASVAVAKSSV